MAHLRAWLPWFFFVVLFGSVWNVSEKANHALIVANQAEANDSAADVDELKREVASLDHRIAVLEARRR